MKFLHIRAFFLILFVPFLLSASSNYLLTEEILKPEASKLINSMGEELYLKTGVRVYCLPTIEKFPVGFNLVKYSKTYEEKMTKPYVLFIFAPYAKITEKSKATGRFGLIPSSDSVRKLYDYDAVRDAGLGVITVKDKNSIEDKHNIGVVQSFSELCDNIADSKGISLTKTIKNESKYIIMFFRIIIYSGLMLIIWVYVLRPRLKRGKDD